MDTWSRCDAERAALCDDLAGLDESASPEALLAALRPTVGIHKTPPLEGPAESLIPVTAGRRAGLDDLTGEGVAVLSSRLVRADPALKT